MCRMLYFVCQIFNSSVQFQRSNQSGRAQHRQSLQTRSRSICRIQCRASRRKRKTSGRTSLVLSLQTKSRRCRRYPRSIYQSVFHQSRLFSPPKMGLLSTGLILVLEVKSDTFEMGLIDEENATTDTSFTTESLGSTEMFA